MKKLFIALALILPLSVYAGIKVTGDIIIKDTGQTIVSNGKTLAWSDIQDKLTKTEEEVTNGEETVQEDKDQD